MALLRRDDRGGNRGVAWHHAPHGAPRLAEGPGVSVQGAARRRVTVRGIAGMSEILDPDRWRRIDAILDAALELPPSGRAGYLDEACAGDSALRREVDELLAADAASDDFLSTPAAERA